MPRRKGEKVNAHRPLRSLCGANYVLTLTENFYTPDGHAGPGPQRPRASTGTSSVRHLGLSEPKV